MSFQLIQLYLYYILGLYPIKYINPLLWFQQRAELLLARKLNNQPWEAGFKSVLNAITKLQNC